MELRHPVVGGPCPGAAAGDDVAADVLVGGEQLLHRLFDLGRLRLLGFHHEMTLVAHDASDFEPLATGDVRQAAGVSGIAAATRHPDHDVDENLAHAAGYRDFFNSVQGTGKRVREEVQRALR